MTTVVTQVPGVQGLPGNAGTNGINSFSALTSGITIPAINSTVTAQVLNSQWIAIGELLFVSDGIKQGTFSVSAVPTTTSVTLKFLGFPLDSAAGQTIGAGGIVTPTGQKFTTPNPLTAYAVNTPSDLTAVDGEVMSGDGSPPTITIPDTGTYMIFGGLTLKALSATMANEVATFHFQRQNNTPASVGVVGTLTLPNSTTIFATTPVTYGLGLQSLPPVAYTPAQANDVLQIWGRLSGQIANFSAGVHSIQVLQAWIVALRIF